MRSRFKTFLLLFLILWGRPAPAPTFREICARVFGSLARQQAQQVTEGTKSVPPPQAAASANFNTVPERLKFLLSVLERHPNIVAASEAVEAVF